MPAHPCTLSGRACTPCSPREAWCPHAMPSPFRSSPSGFLRPYAGSVQPRSSEGRPGCCNDAASTLSIFVAWLFLLSLIAGYQIIAQLTGQVILACLNITVVLRLVWLFKVSRLLGLLTPGCGNPLWVSFFLLLHEDVPTGEAESSLNERHLTWTPLDEG